MADAHQMALLLAIMVVGLPFFSVVNLTVRAFYAVKDTRTPVRVAMVDFLINITVSLILIHWLGIFGIVLADTTAIIAQTFLLHRALVRHAGTHFSALWLSVARVFGGTAVMAAVVGGLGGRSGSGLGNKGGHAIAVRALIPIGVGAYGLTLWFLRIEGRRQLAMLGKLPVLGGIFALPFDKRADN